MGRIKQASKFDLVVKDLFQPDHPSLLDELTRGVAVRAVLNVELARVEERRADLVLLLAEGTILHIEFQSASYWVRSTGAACGRWFSIWVARRCGWRIAWISARLPDRTR